MAEGILDIGDDNFEEEILKASKPSVVDFWAPWCAPCRAIAPLMEELAKDFGDKIKFAKCNVDNNPVTPGKYNIRSIPTIIFFKNGEIVKQVVGMVARSKFEEIINSI